MALHEVDVVLGTILHATVRMHNESFREELSGTDHIFAGATSGNDTGFLFALEWQSAPAILLQQLSDTGRPGSRCALSMKPLLLLLTVISLAPLVAVACDPDLSEQQFSVINDLNPTEEELAAYFNLLRQIDACDNLELVHAVNLLHAYMIILLIEYKLALGREIPYERFHQAFGYLKASALKGDFWAIGSLLSIYGSGNRADDYGIQQNPDLASCLQVVRILDADERPQAVSYCLSEDERFFACILSVDREYFARRRGARQCIESAGSYEQ